jgi:fosfomycin resistance protein FosX
MIEGLSHVTLVVRDLDRAGAFVRDALGGREVYASGEREFSTSAERFYLVGGVWLALMQGEPRERSGYEHVAFKVADADLDAWAERLRGLGIELREGRPRVAGEGRSLYFYDHDDHLFELHTGTLEQRLQRYREG